VVAADAGYAGGTPHGWFCGDSAFQGFDEEKMSWLCRKYGAGYVVVRSEHRLAWPKLYENARCAVYQGAQVNGYSKQDSGASVGNETPESGTPHPAEGG
jgi:hypothetical protein